MWCAGLCGCAAATALPPARFADAPIAQAVEDRLDVPAPPAQHVFYPDLADLRGHDRRAAPPASQLPRSRRALGVDALDEVPDSTWFTDRIGVRA